MPAILSVQAPMRRAKRSSSVLSNRSFTLSHLATSTDLRTSSAFLTTNWELKVLSCALAPVRISLEGSSAEPVMAWAETSSILEKFILFRRKVNSESRENNIFSAVSSILYFVKCSSIAPFLSSVRFSLNISRKAFTFSESVWISDVSRNVSKETFSSAHAKRVPYCKGTVFTP